MWKICGNCNFLWSYPFCFLLCVWSKFRETVDSWDIHGTCMRAIPRRHVVSITACSDASCFLLILDFWNRYQFQYQYSRFWKSMPISIPQFWKFNYNTNTNTENFIIQYQSQSQNQSIAILLSAKTFSYKLLTENPTWPN